MGTFSISISGSIMDGLALLFDDELLPDRDDDDDELLLTIGVDLMYFSSKGSNVVGTCEITHKSNYN